MKRFAMFMICMLMLPGLSLAADQASFENGQTEVVANLAAPGFETTVNLEVPAGYYVTNATMKVTGLPAENNASAYPEGVSIMFFNSVLWTFQQTGFGPLGRQNQFSTGKTQVDSSFGSGGGAKTEYIRLPKEAIIQSATMNVSGFPSVSGLELVNFTGSAASDHLGYSLSNAGDVNNDGYDDVIVAAPGNDAGGNNAGQVYIYFGGSDLDGIADVTFTGEPEDHLGHVVSNAGDVNGDGYDDVVVKGPGTGKMLVYYGGQNMDNISDLNLQGGGNYVSGAGDVNGDGYDDIIVGPYSNSSNTGNAFVYYGGPNMDNIPDLILTGENPGDDFGNSVSGAGDVNNDGFDDIIVGAHFAANHFGRAYIYFGSKTMDNIADVIITGTVSGGDNYFGLRVSNAGDVNNDSYDDIIVGEADGHPTGLWIARIFLGGSNVDNVSDVNLVNVNKGYNSFISSAGDVNKDGYDDVIMGTSVGDAAYVYLGGALMDNISDVNYSGASSGDLFGSKVSGGGDVNADGYDDVIIGAMYNDTGGVDAGSAHVYTCHVPNLTVTGILDPGISIGSKSIWKETGQFNGTAALADFAAELNAYLGSAPISGKDAYGNAYVDVLVNISGSGAGKLSLSNLVVSYSYSAGVPDFASLIGDFLVAHQDDKDANGNIKVPIRIRSQGPGRIKLFDLDIDIIPDLAPALVREVSDAELLENSWNSSLIDLYPYFQDDSDSDTMLDFNVVSATNSSYVTVGIRNKRYLAADAFTGDANDNWTGTVDVVVACADHLGHRTESNKFTITVKNVNDEPVITSTPTLNAEAGVLYNYTLTAIDGDNDKLRFSLPKGPPNMTIDAGTGLITWMPCERGDFNVTVAVSDGTVTVEQSFTVKVPNKAPRITSSPQLNATTGVKYTYTVTADDDNLDALTYSLTSKIAGMDIGASTGTISWTPEYANDYDVVVVVSDGKATAMQEFTVKVSQGNRVPKFISVPVKTATVGLPYEYQARAMDEDADNVAFSLEEPPAGMAIDTGKISWTPSVAGNFTVKIMASDGNGGEKLQEFVISVKDKVKPKVLILQPSLNQKVKGKFTVSGTAVKGTLEVASVQVRIDGGDWTDAAGDYTWQYSLETTKLKNGKHSLEARAFDGKDYSDVATTGFSVDNLKAQGKGFIPGFEVGILMLAILSITSLGVGRRRSNRGELE